MNKTYPPSTIGRRMSTKLPTCRIHDSYHTILQKMSKNGWQSTRNVYVLDDAHRLLGFIDVGDLMQAAPDARASDLVQTAQATLHPHADQEKAVFIAVKNDLVTIPVVDRAGVFLGTITAHTIIDIMHEEHMEDALLSSGIRGKGSDIIKLAGERASLVFKTRAPWLIFGLAIGMSLGFITSLFEETLSTSIALAYFIPVVAYIADSVGSQSSSIAVRALATLKLRYVQYAPKEFIVGLMLGGVLGGLSWLGALLISGDSQVALAVGLALFGAATIAAIFGSFIPFFLSKINKDPALGSGPLATAALDVVSIALYFVIATALVS